MKLRPSTEGVELMENLKEESLTVAKSEIGSTNRREGGNGNLCDGRTARSS